MLQQCAAVLYIGYSALQGLLHPSIRYDLEYLVCTSLVPNVVPSSDGSHNV